MGIHHCASCIHFKFPGYFGLPQTIISKLIKLSSWCRGVMKHSFVKRKFVTFPLTINREILYDIVFVIRSNASYCPITRLESSTHLFIGIKLIKILELNLAEILK